MYEPSKHLNTFFVAGFQHHDGALVLDQLKPGNTLAMDLEPDNPYDPCAIRLTYEGTMLGYVPKDCNDSLSLMLYYGHGSAYECRVLQINPEADPWNQVRVGLYVADAR